MSANDSYDQKYSNVAQHDSRAMQPDKQQIQKAKGLKQKMFAWVPLFLRGFIKSFTNLIWLRTRQQSFCILKIICSFYFNF